MRWLIGGAATILVPLTLWASAALYFDLATAGQGSVLAALYSLFVAGVLVWIRPAWKAIACGFLCFGVVLACWLSLRPSGTRDWQPDVAETAWAETDGDRVTIHNVRNSIYRSETDYTPRWETRVVNVSSVRALDIFITWWGSPWIAHPILSFKYGNDEYLAFSIEVRKEKGEGYSAVRGFFRQFELIYIVSDERDVVRLRTNYRQGEDVYAFRLRTTPEAAQALFMEYIRSINRLREQPQWYNAFTTNCTTDIRRMVMLSNRSAVGAWDWRILLNGQLDEMLYSQGRLAGDIPLAELKQRAHINAVARDFDQAADFSHRIRTGRIEF